LRTIAPLTEKNRQSWFFSVKGNTKIACIELEKAHRFLPFVF
jgi:hypothetical protein